MFFCNRNEETKMRP